MKTPLLLALALLLSLPSPALPRRLSPGSEISLLTCAPGDQLYSLFGHTAIRVQDTREELDIVFNHGTFDFETRGFYLKFARGSLPYQLSCTSFERFMAEYHHYKRSVHEQVLLLDSLQKQRLWETLAENYRPENRAYLYNFLYDNCTTRARDILAASLDGKITWQAPARPKSFWNQLDEYLAVSPWTRWGIHAILGSPASVVATGWEQMFLPDYLMRGVEHARVNGQPLGLPARVLYEAPDTRARTPWYLSPFFVFAVSISCLILVLQRFRSRKLLGSVAFPFFIVTGLLGCLLVFLGYFTLHPTTAPNANLLWANPLNLIAAFFLVKKSLPVGLRLYLRVYLLLLLVALVSWAFLTPAVLFSSMIIIAWMSYLTYRLARPGHPGGFSG
ncbi:MAG: DUF4105 domain-containing protein [Odoribacteraceae bacterium]|jgi:hypothetical protein|nr:DUF4105 domain-containing protein [Odoribacteraceae bacterium]